MLQQESRQATTGAPLRCNGGPIACKRKPRCTLTGLQLENNKSLNRMLLADSWMQTGPRCMDTASHATKKPASDATAGSWFEISE
jgi:hypothetical protein